MFGCAVNVSTGLFLLRRDSSSDPVSLVLVANYVAAVLCVVGRIFEMEQRIGKAQMTNEKPTNPSHGELLDKYADAVQEAGDTFELRSLILGKMGEGEKELAAILRFEGEGDEWFIPAEPGPLGPFSFVEAVKEFMAFMDREFSKLDAIASRLQSELDGQKLILVGRENFIAIVKRQLEAAEARLSAQPDMAAMLEKFVATYAELNNKPIPARPSYDPYVEGATDFSDYISAHLAPQAGVGTVTRLPLAIEGEKHGNGRIQITEGITPQTADQHGGHTENENIEMPKLPAQGSDEEGAASGRGTNGDKSLPLLQVREDHTSEVTAPASHTPRCPKCGDHKQGFYFSTIGSIRCAVNCRACGETFRCDYELSDFAQFFPVTSSQGGAARDFEEGYTSLAKYRARANATMGHGASQGELLRHLTKPSPNCTSEPDSDYSDGETPGPKEQE